MRASFLIALAFATTVTAGCGGEASKASPRETAARPVAAPKRDLTLSTSRIAETEVASPVELARAKPTPPPAPVPRPKARPVPAPAPAVEPEPEAITTPAPVTAPVVSEALAERAPLDHAGSSGRELAPGKTVTMIPVSAGPSVEADEGDSWLPSEPSRGVLVGGGGTCRRRGGGGGIGIAARIRVGGPASSLR